MAAPTHATTGGIDCDIHPAVPGIQALLPYLDDYWRQSVVTRSLTQIDLTMQSYPPESPLSGRPDWRPAKGPPGSDLGLLQAQALDGFGTRLAICNCLYGAPALFSEDFAAAMCRAVNDWLAAEWLTPETRLRASIVVPSEGPELAAAEIEHRASDPRFVQVLLHGMGEMPLGRRHYWPIYEAAERLDLPVGIHAGSLYRHPPTQGGWPSYYLEDYVSYAQGFESQLLSLIHEGVFIRFPKLKIVLIESGFTWLPGFLWRADKTWRGVREEVPWVDRAPSQFVREHVRFTLQPVDAPPDPAKLERIIEQMGSDRLLLFSTDYPHWHYDGEGALPPALSASLARRILFDNPLETYPRLAAEVTT
jgi:uncharacterized protein